MKYINLNFRLYAHLEYATFRTEVNKITFIYKLVPPAIKDQYRESPNADSYVSAGLNEISNNLDNVMILIDAGPRHYIFDKVISIMNKKKIDCLFDAHRPEYIKVLNKYDGFFFVAKINY